MITATLRHLRIAPRKVRLVADLIRGKSVEEAQTALNFTTKKAARYLLTLLNSAVANAKNNFNLDVNLYISKITVDEGPKLKRWRARARGSAYEIQKKSSHVNLVLSEITESKRPKKIKKAITAAEGGETKIEESRPEKGRGEKTKFKPAANVKKPAGFREARKMFRRQVF